LGKGSQHTGTGLFGEPGSPGNASTKSHAYSGRHSAALEQGRMHAPEMREYGTGEQTDPLGQGTSAEQFAVQYPLGAGVWHR
jgi:hypothetical protein